MGNIYEVILKRLEFAEDERHWDASFSHALGAAHAAFVLADDVLQGEEGLGSDRCGELKRRAHEAMRGMLDHKQRRLVSHYSPDGGKVAVVDTVLNDIFGCRLGVFGADLGSKGGRSSAPMRLQRTLTGYEAHWLDPFGQDVYVLLLNGELLDILERVEVMESEDGGMLVPLVDEGNIAAYLTTVNEVARNHPERFF